MSVVEEEEENDRASATATKELRNESAPAPSSLTAHSVTHFLLGSL
jgi:hypothetical protein